MATQIETTSTESTTGGIVQSLDNAPARRREADVAIKKIDKAAQIKITEMVKSAKSIREIAIDVVVAGVQIAVIANSDYTGDHVDDEDGVTPAWDAWQDFVHSHHLACKGGKAMFREIANVLWRKLAEKDGSLSEMKLSRERRSKYGAAIFRCYRWYVDGTPLEKLAERIAKVGGVWAVATLKGGDQSHAEDTSIEPTAEEPAQERVENLPLTTPAPAEEPSIIAPRNKGRDTARGKSIAQLGSPIPLPAEVGNRSPGFYLALVEVSHDHHASLLTSKGISAAEMDEFIKGTLR